MLISLVSLGSFAYLSKKTETLTNTFIIGNINEEETKLEEPNFPKNSDGIPIAPGTFVAKDPTVTVGKNSVDSYVYIAIKNKLVLKTNDPFINDNLLEFYSGDSLDNGNIINRGSKGFSSDWEEVVLIPSGEGEDPYTLHLYRYKDVVKNNPNQNSTLTPIFTSVYFREDVSSSHIEKLVLDSSMRQNVEVTALVLQVIEGKSLEFYDEEAENILCP